MCCSARGLALELQPILNVALLTLIRVTDSDSVNLSIIGATGGEREREGRRNACKKIKIASKNYKNCTIK